MKESKQLKNIGASHWYVERDVSRYDILSYSYYKATIYEKWKGREKEEVEVGDTVVILKYKTKGIVKSVEKYRDGVLNVFVKIGNDTVQMTSRRIGILEKGSER